MGDQMTTKTTSMLKRTFAVAALLSLAACTQAFRSDVSTFHTIGAATGGTVAIIPMNPDRKDSLEFKQYAALIGQSLRQYGFRPSGDSKPDMVVGFDVKMNDGREKLLNRPSSYGAFDSWGYYGGHWGGYWGGYGPYSYDSGWHNELVARTVYHTELSVEIHTKGGEKIFEGRAETDARKNDLPGVMPLLTQSLFQDFPGPSGVTRRVKIELED